MKTINILAGVLATLFLAGCGTYPFAPVEHVLRDDAISNFTYQGDIVFVNGQSDQSKVILHSYGGTSFEGDLHSMTASMVAQAKSELARHGNQLAPGSGKSISLKVTYLTSRYIAIYWKSDMTFEVELGNGTKLIKHLKHTTGAGAAQNLNGSIADAVVELFSDSQVLEYLAGN